jgi:hypothetical protein
LVDLKLKIKDTNLVREYETNLFNEEFFDIFGEQLSQELENYSKSAI